MYEEIYQQMFGRSHMSGVERDNKRIRRYAEHFTPTDLAFESLDTAPQLSQPGEIVLDPFAGDFTLLCCVIWRKLQNGVDHQQALQEIRSGEWHIDNCLIGIERLYGCGEVRVLQGDQIPKHMKADGLTACFTHNNRLLENHVACDSDRYDFSFGKPIVFGQGLLEISINH